MRRISILLALMLFCVIAYPQSRTVNGKVMTEDGSPVPFASVSEKGTTSGVSADANGNFTINMTGKVLVVSSTGYETQEVNVSGNSVEVVLKATIQSMSEVIVTGVVGATDAKKMTVSVTKIDADKLTKVPPTSLSSALTGKVAGVKA